MPTMTAAEIAHQLAGEVVGDPAITLTGFAPADRAQAGDLTFAENDEYLAAAEKSSAAAIIAGKNTPASAKTLIRVAQPRIAFAKVLAIFYPEPAFAPGIHSSAVVAPSAHIDPSAFIGPFCHVADGVTIGAHCVLESHVAVGADSVLGEGTRIYPNVTVYARSKLGQRVRVHSGSVIGSDGFGYVLDGAIHRKVPQIGDVVIGDDVEIGANVTIDRGALGSTQIGKGTKIDNQVHIAHNVILGDHCILCGQVGIAGSAKLGSYVVLAGQVGIAGHLQIGDQVTVGSKAGVMHNIPSGQKWMGLPAQPDQQAKRIVIAVQRLPDLLKKIAVWEKKLSGES